MPTLHDFSAKTIDGQEQSLRQYAGKTLLLVNVASRCGLTPHYAGLEELYRRFRDRGFAVLGFPCNQFAEQEPGTEAEIKQFCSTKYDVTFPLFAKVDVNGPRRHPVFEFLTSQPTAPEGPGDIVWNFTKFVVDKSGKVVARFAPQTDPQSADIVGAIDQALA